MFKEINIKMRPMSANTSILKISKITYKPDMPVDKLEFNPLNPRLTKLIPEEELKLDELCNSILEVGGILVPLVVFPKNDKYVVLDGERRLRAAKKLNMRVVPVNIIPKALNDYENLSRMFNIHLQREQWNTAARAISLGKLEKLLPNVSEDQIRAMTGMGRTEYRNAKRILSFPEELQNRAVKGELNPNYLIEMAKALENLEKYYPEILEEYGRDLIIKKWISKIDRRIVKNNTLFRIVGRICRNLSEKKATELIKRLIEEDNYKFEDAWDEAEEEIASDLVDLFKLRCEKFINDLKQFKINRQSPTEIIEIRKVLERILSEVQKKLEEMGME